jgi:hypothetical protein
MITLVIGTAQSRYLRLLGPRPWDPGTLELEPAGRGVRVTMDVRTATHAIAQLQARGDHRTAARIRELLRAYD